jgi:hypothetical protein
LIRRARYAEIPRILYLGSLFHAGAKHSHGYNEDHAAEMLDDCMWSDNKVALVYTVCGEVVGFLLGSLTSTWQAKELVASELAWFVEKEHRGFGAIKLVHAFENWATEEGADAIAMADIEGLTDLQSTYERLGYRKVETTYVKRI